MELPADATTDLLFDKAHETAIQIRGLVVARDSVEAAFLRVIGNDRDGVTRLTRTDRRDLHDVGYERYAGLRATASPRWWVIARHELEMAWQTWWRYKAALALAVIVTAVFAGLMYFLTETPMFRGFHMIGRLPLTIADGAVPASLQWFRRVAFVLTVTTAVGTIAGDRQSGAFALYVARATRPIDYIVGKLAAVLVLTASVVVVGPLLLALLRLGLFDSSDALIANLVIVPKVLAIGALATLTYAIVPLGCSALFALRRQAIAVWAVYWVVIGTVVGLLGAITTGWISAFDLASALDSIAYQLFDLHLVRRLQIPFGVALGSVALHVALAMVIIVVCVRRAHKEGLGAQS